MIIGISGKIGSGKDTIASIVQYLTSSYKEVYNCTEWLNRVEVYGSRTNSNWQVKKFADKLKDMVCLLLNCTRAQLEDRDFKEKELSDEWSRFHMPYDFHYKTIAQLKEELKKPGVIAESLDALNFGDFYSVTLYRDVVKMTPRKLLQLLGTDCGRNIIHSNVWVNALMSEYRTSLEDVKEDWKLQHKFPNWIITDVRFPNEMRAVRDKRGVVIRVNRHNEQDGSDYGWGNPNANHESETALDRAIFDLTITNSGTIEDLVPKVEKFLKAFKLIN